MNWDDAKIFLAVAAIGSYAGAGRELGLTHPTVSRRIQNLESTLGGRLFDKNAHGSVLTPRGEKLLEHAEAMAQAAGHFEATANEIIGLQGVVRVSCGSPMHSFILKHLPGLYLKYPELRIELDDSTDYVNLSRGEADIAIRSRLPETGALKTKKLVDAEMAVFAAHAYLERHPLVMPKELSQHDWANHDWVVHDERMSHYPYMQWLMPQLTNKPPRLRVMRRYSQIEAMINGIGLGVLPVLEGARFRELDQVSPALPELRFSQYIIAHEANLKSSRVRFFWGWLSDIVKQHRNDFECLS